MENHDVIHKIVNPVRDITYPTRQSTFPDARVKGRVITTKVKGVGWCRKSGHELRDKRAILSKTGVQNGKRTQKAIHRRI